MKHFREIFEKFLPGPKSYDCALWAFGEGFDKLDLSELMDRWNERHKDIFELYGNGAIEIDIPKIVVAWEEKRHRNFIDTPQYKK
jgi:hypothetical protein